MALRIHGADLALCTAKYHHYLLDTPIDPLLLIARNDYLSAIRFSSFDRRPYDPPKDSIEDHGVFAEVIEQIDAYFAGDLQTFDLDLAPAGTPFQHVVWNSLCKISYGESRSYGDVARAMGRPTASRAVGGANNKNPIPIIVPCHRVIGSNGKLVGYAGGLDRKHHLLALEAGQRRAN